MVQPVSDDQLATEGMQLHNQGRVLLIACGALAREILALMKANDWQHMDLQCLPAVYHNTPDKITPAVKACIEKNRDNYSEIFVAYADCGTGGQLQTLCDAMGVSMISGPHCYSFYEGNAAFEACEELTAFISLIFWSGSLMLFSGDQWAWTNTRSCAICILEITPHSSIKHSSKTLHSRPKRRIARAEWGLLLSIAIPDMAI